MYALCVALCGSACEAVYLATVPRLLVWALLYRRRWHKRLSMRHVLETSVRMLAMLLVGGPVAGSGK